MKYLILYWDEYHHSSWLVYWYGTNYREAVKRFNKCKKEYRECKLIQVGETMKEQRA